MPRVNIRVQKEEALAAIELASYLVSAPGVAMMLKGPVLQYLQEQVALRFDRQGDRSSGPWAELSPATQHYRLMQGFNPTWPINVRFGDFRAWLEHNQGDFDSAGFASTLTFPNASSGPMEDKLRAAQEGKGKGARTFPARPVVSLDAADAATILSLMEVQIHTVLAQGAAGFTQKGLAFGGGMGYTAPKGFGGGPL